MTYSRPSCHSYAPAFLWLPDPVPEHGIEVPENEIKRLNRSEADHLKLVPEDLGTGYVGILEAFHQQHCLVSIPLPILHVPAHTLTSN